MFVGFDDTVQHCSFCYFGFLESLSYPQPDSRWGGPVPALGQDFFQKVQVVVVVTFFKSSTVGNSEFSKVQEDLYGLQEKVTDFEASIQESRWELRTGT